MAWQAAVAKPIGALAVSTFYDADGDWQFHNYDCRWRLNRAVSLIVLNGDPQRLVFLGTLG